MVCNFIGACLEALDGVQLQWLSVHYYQFPTSHIQLLDFLKPLFTNLDGVESAFASFCGEGFLMLVLAVSSHACAGLQRR